VRELLGAGVMYLQRDSNIPTTLSTHDPTSRFFKSTQAL
jgi:hypothetical protein